MCLELLKERQQVLSLGPPKSTLPIRHFVFLLFVFGSLTFSVRIFLSFISSGAHPPLWAWIPQGVHRQMAQDVRAAKLPHLQSARTLKGGPGGRE